MIGGFEKGNRTIPKDEIALRYYYGIEVTYGNSGFSVIGISPLILSRKATS